jgi:carbonic anhydrase/SulP family sulfate permease
MTSTTLSPKSPGLDSIRRDLVAGLVVFLVALPLCLGIALASNAPLMSGIISGIVGGILVGWLSGSHTSVSGPAAGLTAVVALQISSLGSFEAFLTAVVLAGVIQVGLGMFKLGFLADFVPSSVIKGLLAAIGVILILKQIPHVLGHDPDPMGEMSFAQVDRQNTFSEIWATMTDIQPTAAVIGVLSVLLLLFWKKIKPLASLPVPAPLIIVVLGVVLERALSSLGGRWMLADSHLVKVPVSNSFGEFLGVFTHPDFGALGSAAVFGSAVTIAIVASLETLLNLEAVDRIDPKRRVSPPSRELVAQGAGNVVAGLLGGLPMTSVIVRSSVNISAGARTKLSAISHGVMLLAFVALLPGVLNMIPLAALGAILLVTGLKLASPALFVQMSREGPVQFMPFAVTVGAIVFTDLLTGIVIGLVVALGFILHSNLRRPIKRVIENHVGGEVLRIELANQVSFLNRAALLRAFDAVPTGSHVLIDARSSDFIDPDVLDMIVEFDEVTAPARGVNVSLIGFQKDYERLNDKIQYVDYSSREVQGALDPDSVLDVFRAGNERFRKGEQLTRDYSRQVGATSTGQFPMAVVLSCIDSRTPVELIFDLGLGDVFSVRMAGNVARDRVLGSMEYGCVVAGARLLLVMGHTACGAVGAAVDFMHNDKPVAEVTGCDHLHFVLDEIQKSIDPRTCKRADQWGPGERNDYADRVARANVVRTIHSIREASRALADLEKTGKCRIVGALYDVRSGSVEFFEVPRQSPARLSS